MVISLLAPAFDEMERRTWLDLFTKESPGLRVAMDNVLVDEEDVEGAIVYYPPKGQLARYRRLRIIVSLSAGVEGILADPQLPNVPIVRLMNSELRWLMREYIIYQVLRITRRFDQLEECRRAGRWVWANPDESAAQWKVLVLGLGQLGRSSAEALHALGFQVSAWSRMPHSIPGLRCVSGRSGLESVLPESDIVVCLLPLTPETRGVLDANLFSKLPRGASLINAGRGGCLHEQDMLSALDTGQLSRVTLDVFDNEPLPEDHVFWSHPRINITPHSAAHPTPAACVPQILEYLERCRRGLPLPDVVDRLRGY